MIETTSTKIRIFFRQIKSSPRSSKELSRYRKRELEFVVGDIVFIKVLLGKESFDFRKEKG